MCIHKTYATNPLRVEIQRRKDNYEPELKEKKSRINAGATVTPIMYPSLLRVKDIDLCDVQRVVPGYERVISF